MAKLLPIILLIIGIGAGIGAGIMFAPAPVDEEMALEEGAEGKDDLAKEEEPEPNIKPGDVPIEARDFVAFENQFVIPVVRGDDVVSLVVLSLSLEAKSEMRPIIQTREPRLRDQFLSVLFDHANMGGFRGAFTSAENMELLRRSLRETAQKELGKDVLDVLITDIARQDT
ncbi:MAG: flagellar basal body-associated FliL family protein [Sedimentitalea sp.]